MPPLPGILQGTGERGKREIGDSLLIVYETNISLLEIACEMVVGGKRDHKNLGAIEVNADFLELFPISKFELKITDDTDLL